MTTVDAATGTTADPQAPTAGAVTTAQVVAAQVVADTRRRLGRYGVWLAAGTLLAAPVAVQRRQFDRIERLGYGSLWGAGPPAGGPGSGREAFAQHGLILAATERIIVGTGIANVSVREPAAMHTGAATLAEAYPDRFVLGLGGQQGSRPLTALGDYLRAVDDVAAWLLPTPRYPRVLAALGPRAHRLARDHADGVHPFLQPVAHTAAARAAVGPDRLVIPHQAVLLEADPATARGRLRAVFNAGARSPRTPGTTGASATATRTCPADAATGWSTTSSRGETRPPCRRGWPPTWPPAPTTCSCTRSPQTCRPRSTSSNGWPRC